MLGVPCVYHVSKGYCSVGDNCLLRLGALGELQRVSCVQSDRRGV